MKNDARTRTRLLRSAEELFGARGFKKVTVRDICSDARANVAAVNYHFGDKLGLYREVLQSAIAAMRASNGKARSGGLGRPPDEQLRIYLRLFLNRVLSPESASIHRLISREISDPTPAIDALVEEGVRPRIEYLSSVIARIMECDAKDRRVLRCVGSLQAQVLTYLRNPIAERLGFAFKPTKANIEELADHIATFSLAGIRAVGRVEKRRRL